ncbi:MAG: PilW family protein [Candidatus Methylomirabilales bacterium]
MTASRAFARSRRPHPRGAGLLEILIVLGMLGFITGGLFTFFLATSATYRNEAVRARMLQNAARAMTAVARDLRGAGTFATMPAGCIQVVEGANAGSGWIRVRTLLNDPAGQTSVAPAPPVTAQNSAVLRVLSTPGFAAGDFGLIADGAQCSLFRVTTVIGGANPALQHNPSEDVNSPGGFGHEYAAGSPVYRLSAQRTVRYAVDASGAVPWLTREVDSGGPIRLVPDIQALQTTFVLDTGASVDPASITTAAQAAAVRVVILRLTAQGDVPTGASAPGGRLTHTLVSRVQLRNLAP